MKKTNIITILLIIYLVAISWFSWSYYMAQGAYVEYYSIMGASLFVIFLLRYVLKKKEGIRNENRRKREAADRRVHRNDDIL